LICIIKKALALLITLIISVCLFSCKDEKTFITDVNSYSCIWDLPEFRIVETELFPPSIDEESCFFNCEHVVEFLLGTRWQIELSIEFDDESYETETKRIKELSRGSVVFGESEYFDIPAYATVWNWNGCYEYALFNESTKTITYIYLQLNNKDQLTITNSYIPKNYSLTMNDVPEFTIYF